MYKVLFVSLVFALGCKSTSPAQSDGAVPLPDAGVPAMDAAEPALDADVSAEDAALPIQDAGIVPDDASLPTLDAGFPIGDAAMPVQDAGMPMDAATPMDAGTTLDIVDALAALPNVISVTELAPEGAIRNFSIEFTQPLDHLDDSGPHFSQWAVLHHVDMNAPTVIITSGYDLGDAELYRAWRTEPAQLLDANQLFVGHRFFGGALPAFADQDWSKLNIEQAARDNHAIVTALRSIYSGHWIGTGWSKGGMTAIFHEHFFPEDLDLVIPMVAPISFSLRDARYPGFLAQIGTDSCRQKLEGAIIDAFARVPEMAAQFNPPGAAAQIAYEQYMRVSLIGFQWSYWQFLGYDYCARIPDASTASAASLVNFYVYVGGFFAPRRPIRPDEAGLIAYTYQAFTQLGLQDSLPIGFLDRLDSLDLLRPGDRELTDVTVPDNPPWGDELPEFDPQAMRDVDDWLRADASDMLAVYGEYDPWTAGMVTLNPANRSKVYVAPTRSHATFLADLTRDDLDEVVQRILEHRSAQPRSTRTATARRLDTAHIEANRKRLTALLRDRHL